MAIVLTEEGGQVLWNTILGLTPAAGLPRVHLLGANHAIAHSDTETVLVASEASGAGYAPILVSPAASWVVATLADGAQATYPTLTWTFTSAITIYGYWLSDNTNTYSLFGETFTNPFIYTSSGGVFLLNLLSYLVSQPFTLGPCY